MCIRGRGVVQGLAFSVMLLMGACSPVVPEPTISPATVADTPDFAPLAATIEAEMAALPTYQGGPGRHRFLTVK